MSRNATSAWARPDPATRQPQYFTRQRFIIEYEACVGTLRPSMDDVLRWIEDGIRANQTGLEGRCRYLSVTEATKR